MLGGISFGVLAGVSSETANTQAYDSIAQEEDPNSNAILRPRTAGGSVIAVGAPPAAAPPSPLRSRLAAAGSATGPSGPGPSRLGVSSGPSASLGSGVGAARPAFSASPFDPRPAPVRLDEPLPPAPAASGPSAVSIIDAKKKEAEETKDAATRLRELQERNRLKSAGGLGLGLGLGATTPPSQGGGMGMGMGIGGGGWPAQPHHPHQSQFPHDMSALPGGGSSGVHGEASFTAGAKPRLAPLGGPGSGAGAAGHQAAAAAAAASLGINSKTNLTWLVESPVGSRQSSVSAPHGAAGIPGSLPSVSQHSLSVAAAEAGGHHTHSRFAQQPQAPQAAAPTAYPALRNSAAQLEAQLLAAAASPPRHAAGGGTGFGSAVGSAAGTASGAAPGAGGSGSAGHSASGEQAVFAFASHIPLPGARPGNRPGGAAGSSLAPLEGQQQQQQQQQHHHSTPGSLGGGLGAAHVSHGAAGYHSQSLSGTGGGGANFDGLAAGSAAGAGGGRGLQHQGSSGKGSFGRGGMQAPPQGPNLTASTPHESGLTRTTPLGGGGGGGGFGLAAESYGARPVTPAERRKEAAAANEAMLSSLLGGAGGGVDFASVKVGCHTSGPTPLLTSADAPHSLHPSLANAAIHLNCGVGAYPLPPALSLLPILLPLLRLTGAWRECGGGPGAL